MDLREAIDVRVSRRSYLRLPVRKDALQRLCGDIEAVNAASGLSVRLVPDGSQAFRGLKKSYGIFKNVRSLILLAGKKSDTLLSEKAGYYGELLVLEATRLGLGTCWVGGTYDKSSLANRLGEGEKLVCVVTMGYAKESKSLRESLMHSVTHRKTRSSEALCELDGTPPPWFYNGLYAVSKAPSAVNRQPYKLVWSEAKPGVAGIKGTGEYHAVDIGIAKAHFAIGAGGSFELGENGIFKKTDSGFDWPFEEVFDGVSVPI